MQKIKELSNLQSEKFDYKKLLDKIVNNNEISSTDNFLLFMKDKDNLSVDEIKKDVRFTNLPINLWKYQNWFKSNFKIDNKCIQWKNKPNSLERYHAKIPIDIKIDVYLTLIKHLLVIGMKEAFFLAMENRKHISRKECIKIIVKITGYTKDSVNCSTFDPNHWGKTEWFLSHFIINPKNRSISWRKKDQPKKSMLNFNNPGKNSVRPFVFNTIKNITKPIIALNANEYGHDVKLARSINPNAIIHNIEKYKLVLEKYKTNKYKTFDHRMTINKFFEKNTIHFDVVWIDCCWYYSKKMSECLTSINKGQMTNELSITLGHTKNVRNGDIFSKNFRLQYGKHVEPQKSAIDDILSNYVYVDRINYQSSMNGSLKNEVVLKYKLI